MDWLTLSKGERRAGCGVIVAAVLAALVLLFFLGRASAAPGCENDHLAWDPSEAGASYTVRLEGALLGTTTATSWPIGCATGLFSVVATDQAGNASMPSWYAEGGPCALGCLQPGSPPFVAPPCCAPVRPPS